MQLEIICIINKDLSPDLNVLSLYSSCHCEVILWEKTNFRSVDLTTYCLREPWSLSSNESQQNHISHMMNAAIIVMSGDVSCTLWLMKSRGVKCDDIWSLKRIFRRVPQKLIQQDDWSAGELQQSSEIDWKFIFNLGAFDVNVLLTAAV